MVLMMLPFPVGWPRLGMDADSGEAEPSMKCSREDVESENREWLFERENVGVSGDGEARSDEEDDKRWL